MPRWVGRVRALLRGARSVALPLVLVPAVVGLARCSPPEPSAELERQPAPPVAIIGWDGATWDVLDPLLDQRRLPNLARLIERGSRGVLVAGWPLLSPVAWTTLATGFPPAEHGVTGFEMPDPKGGPPILASTFHRRRAALWQMVSASEGSDVGFIGWWTTWPAEPVRGYMVSDHLAYNRWDAWARRPRNQAFHLAFPPELAAALAGVAVRPEEVAVETLTSLVPFNARERREMMQAARPVMFHAPSVFRFGYCTDASNMNFARHLLLHRKQPHLFSTVFILSDVAGHVFWHHYQPDAFPEAGPDAGRLREAIPNVYAQLDSWLGELLTLLSPDTRVLLISDHGMRPTGELPRPSRNPAGDHSPGGVLVVAGDGVPAGLELGEVSSLDLAPTVLALLGLPVARDMPGRVLLEIVDPKGERTGRWIATYGTGLSPREELPESPAEESYRERLRSLGYIE